PGNRLADSRIGRRLKWTVPRRSARRESAPADGESEAAVIHAEESKGTGDPLPADANHPHGICPEKTWPAIHFFSKSRKKARSPVLPDTGAPIPLIYEGFAILPRVILGMGGGSIMMKV